MKIYHNPRCSKSRQTLSILQEKGIEPEIIVYLETPPTVEVLNALIEMLGITPRELLRKGEEAYKSLGLSDPTISNEELINAMVENPKLIERPIVTDGKRAILGRPPENVYELL